MAKKIKAINLNKEVEALLKDFAKATPEKILEALDEVLEDGANQLKNVTGVYNVQSDDYNAGWTYSTELKNNKFKGAIYNATHYSLAGWLENGHATRNGGRTKEFVHIAPVNDKVQKEFEIKLKEKLENE